MTKTKNNQNDDRDVIQKHMRNNSLWRFGD